MGILRIWGLIITMIFTQLIVNAQVTVGSKSTEESADSVLFFISEDPVIPKKSVVIRRAGPNRQIVSQPAHILRKKTEAVVHNNNWKWIGSPHENITRYYIRTRSDIAPELDKLGIRVLHEEKNLMLVETRKQVIEEKLINHSSVLAIQPADREPRVESLIRRHNLSANGISLVHHDRPLLNGRGLYCSIKEDAFQPADPDIETRALLDEHSSELITSHATDMATLVGGAGNTWISGRGVASEAGLFSESFELLLPNAGSYFLNNSISVQNHSYGVGVENFYGVESVAFDEQALELPSLLHVFSSGNSGKSKGSGTYEEVDGMANLTGSFKQAKNVLVVTAASDDGLIPEQNSRGPAYDGRIRPELTAYGGEGTSDAAALVSGAALLLQEHFRNTEGDLPPSDMVRALLIAGAEDTGEAGPDFISGYGVMNLSKSLLSLDSGWYRQGLIGDGESANFNIVLNEGKKDLRVVLVWRDAPANEGDYMALVNDLDLSISSTGGTFLPWVLDTSPTAEALAKPAEQGEDHLNTVELISIENAVAGTYNVQVAATHALPDQAYSIAWYAEPREAFQWVFPTSSNPLLSGKETNLYWENNHNLAGMLEISYGSGLWELVSENVLPGQGFLPFTPPAGYSEAILRMTFGEKFYLSDTFTISPHPGLEVALNCDDRFILSWNKLADDLSYEVLAYNNGSLSVVEATSDTSVTFSKASQTVSSQGLYYTVRPVKGNRPGLPNETLRVDRQAVGCFLNNFLAALTPDDVAEVQLSMSGWSLIEQVVISKTFNGETEVIYDNIPPSPWLVLYDDDLQPGITTYQATIIPAGSEAIRSDEINVYFAGPDTFILYPNPTYGGIMYFLSPRPGATLQVLSNSGMLLTEYEIVNELEEIPLGGFVPGTYLYRVIDSGSVLKTGRFIVP